MDDNKKLLMARIMDEARIAERGQRVIGTSFYDPATARYVEQILSGFEGLSYYRFGGYPEAERTIFILFPYYMDQPSETFIQALKIKWDPRFYQVDHRDILGSLIGTGIKRDKIGDIITDQGFAHAFVSSELAPYIAANLHRVGKAPVSVVAMPCEQAILSEPKVKSITTTVASPRLDSILSSCFAMSRTKALPYIKNGLVSVNWAVVEKPDYMVSPGDVISVRGLGRGKVKEFGRTTKKDRMFVVLEKYL